MDADYSYHGCRALVDQVIDSRHNFGRWDPKKRLIAASFQGYGYSRKSEKLGEDSATKGARLERQADVKIPLSLKARHVEV